MDLKKAIREIENFPKEGINFKDITTLMQDGETFKYTIDAFINELKDKNVDVIVGPEARGFLMGTPVAYGLRLLPEIYMKIYMLNPMTPIITSFRYIFFGTGYFHAGYYGVGWGSTMILFVLVFVRFYKVESTVFDTI